MLTIPMLTMRGKLRVVEPSIQSAMVFLPDELIIRILTVPLIDLKSLFAFAKTSTRFYALVLCVLKNHRLPNIQLITVIDQEGRGRWTNHFKFLSLDDHTLCATFAVQSMTPRRYRSEAEFPTLRHLSVADNTIDAKFAPSWTTVASKERGYKSAKDANLVNRSIRRQKMSTKRDGVQVIESFSTVFSQCRRRLVWRFTYFVSRNEDARLPRRQNPTSGERYVAPMYLTVHLSLLSGETCNGNRPPCTWIQTVHGWFRNKCDTLKRPNPNKHR